MALEDWKRLLNDDIQTFISQQVGQSISTLALQKNPFPTFDWRQILQQIEAKTKAKEKLPTWFKTPKIIYPSKVSVEQTSSEITADYKASLIFGKTLIDLTGGYGVDAFYFAKHFEKVVHCEHEASLSKRVLHNYNQLQVTNITCLSGESERILENLQTTFDWIYIDPSRRNESKGKVFLLRDCEPNVPELLNFYFQFSLRILIKTAPLLDLTVGLQELKNVAAIHIVAVENEVKELLWEIHHDFSGNPMIKTVNISKKGKEHFDFEMTKNKFEVTFSEPLTYLFEPNAAVMKSGGFSEIAKHYPVLKLHSQTHLYTSDKIMDFCGRIFEIQQKIDYSKTNMKRLLENQKANITTRNFPETVEHIRKKWKIKDGGDLYCFFATDLNNQKIVLLCKKIK
ncbi:class I SAM-dependent methyltransferase [Flavobacterium sp.]|uniref:THUMP-like domain-containing protein n=1 Tax=Flavobacterium sp. TaxID=239 RepID=UPI0026052659|nr:class I SAM-dependent methyltransferase [Flavobacterium sp.]MDD2986192.1 class I SAM-dependent methyltransferase [Flavobacterium sp.]